MPQLAAHNARHPLTIPEVRWFLYRLVVSIVAPPEAVLHRSCWRRLYHTRATRAHYPRRLKQQVVLE